MAQRFTKPSLSIQDQLALLESRGLLVEDRAAAEHCLQHISYYRLRAYGIYFEQDATPSVHGFIAGTSFDQILALYDFDRRLRLLMLDGIERIEIAVRGSWAHHMAMTYGPHGYLRASLYKTRQMYGGNRATLEREVARSHEDFIAHYNSKHGSPKLPPVWMVSEIISLGQLSKWQTALRQRSDIVAIARPFGLDFRVYQSFVHHLSTVRNLCAHHGRLWNRQFTVTLTLPQRPANLAVSVDRRHDRNIYNTIVMMLHFMMVIAPHSGWRSKLIDLLLDHPVPDLASMGFPADWRTRPLWT
jgi:abortive infection bacteriophage resistance protein